MRSLILKNRTRRNHVGFHGLLATLLLASTTAFAQTETDAIMMNKNQFCAGFVYGYSSWDHYWEGTRKRNNLNLGTVSTQSLIFMANYGISNKLNVMVSAPQIWTKASAGTLRGMEGIQDFGLNLKWKAHTMQKGNNKLSLFLVGGFSTPITNYVVDHLPLSIGLGSTNLSGRVIVDYYRNHFFATGSAAFVWRSNVEIDRTSYYDTESHLSREVKMPHVANYLLRTGYRGKYLIAEAMLGNMTTLGGFDITRNNMPFPSNRMNATQVGLGAKYTLPAHTNLAFIGGANYTLAGRNMGQATSFNGGIFYALYFKKQQGKNDNNLTELP